MTGLLRILLLNKFRNNILSRIVSHYLLGSQSEWQKDKPFPLMHSRHARNLGIWFENKMNLINCVDAFWDNSIYKHLDQAISTLEINFKRLFPMYHFKWINLASTIFNFHAWVKNCHISLLKNCQSGTI